MFDVVETPVFAQNIVDPVVHAIQERIPENIQKIIGGVGEVKDEIVDEGAKKQQQPTCAEFEDILKEADLGQETTCRKSSNECWTDIHDIEFYDGLKIRYRWGSGLRRDAACEEVDDFIRCYFPRNAKEDKVSYWIVLNNCTEDLGYSEGWGPEEAQPQNPPLSKKVACCDDIIVSKVDYYKPTVLRLLEVELSCDSGSWGLQEGECISGETYIGDVA